MHSYDYDNSEDVVSALLNDPHFEFKNRGAYLQKGRCPGCGKKELFISKNEPWRLVCNRKNKCDYTETTRDRYPELFNNFAQRYPATDQNRNATADAYMACNRQFPVEKIQGWYEQGSYKLKEQNEWCVTVRFYLHRNPELYWERLVDKQKDNGQRINFGGERHNINNSWVFKEPLKGKWWMPPEQELVKGDRVYWVEGIFHALALYFSGYKVIASLAAGYFPSEDIKPHLGKDITWVLALDDDKAGREFMARHHQKLKADLGEVSEVCLTGSKYDWDDLYRLNKINDEFLLSARYRGLMFTARNIFWKAYAFYLWKRSPIAVLEHANRLFSVKVDTIGLQKALEGDELRIGAGFEPFSQNCTARPISNFYPELLYAERDDILDEKFYLFRISYSSNNPQALIALEGSSIDTPSSFHKAMISRGYGTFSGAANDMSLLHEQWLNKKIKEIRSIPYVGYHNETQIYVYRNFAFKGGEKLDLNEEGFFEHESGGIKTSFKGFNIQEGTLDPTWIQNFITAFSSQGLTALAFWLGSLFVQQIRAKQKSFPFLELTGDPGAGKSTLIEFLWKLLGRDDYEGFDAIKSTAAGRRRAFTQSSNMPLVLIESDRGDEPDIHKKKQFDFDELKPMFNGRAVGTLGVAKRGNDTEEPLFQGALVFAQNAEVAGSEPLLQRIIHCHCTTGHHNLSTRKIAEWFEGQGVDQLAGFLQLALSKEKEILATIFSSYEKYKTEFTERGSIKSSFMRLVKNHAQIMACGDALTHIFPSLTTKNIEDLRDYLYGRAVTRQDRLASDHPILQQFWDTYEYLNQQEDPQAFGRGPMIEVLNHSINTSRIAINLNHFDEMCRKHGQQHLDLKLLKRLLKNSRRYKYIETGKVRSAVLRKPIHCWQFQKEAS